MFLLPSQCPISCLPCLYFSALHPVSPLVKAFANTPALHFFVGHYHNRVIKPVWLRATTKKRKSNQPQLLGQLEKTLLQLKQMWQSCGQARECSERANLQKPHSRALANSPQSPWPIISSGNTFSGALRGVWQDHQHSWCLARCTGRAGGQGQVGSPEETWSFTVLHGLIIKYFYNLGPCQVLWKEQMKGRACA